MTAADGILAIYTPDLIALSEETRQARRLPCPPAVTGRAVSPICGSTVDIDLLIENGVISDIGFDVDGCALTRATVAILNRGARGQTPAALMAAGDAMHNLLKNGDQVTGTFAALNALSGARDYPARHDALLLAFSAARRALGI